MYKSIFVFYRKVGYLSKVIQKEGKATEKSLCYRIELNKQRKVIDKTYGQYYTLNKRNLQIIWEQKVFFKVIIIAAIPAVIKLVVN